MTLQEEGLPIGFRSPEVNSTGSELWGWDLAAKGLVLPMDYFVIRRWIEVKLGSAFQAQSRRLAQPPSLALYGTTVHVSSHLKGYPLVTW